MVHRRKMFVILTFIQVCLFVSADVGDNALCCNSQASLDGLEDFRPKICL